MLNYPKDYYTPSTLQLADVLSEKDMRQEYARLRKIANKRLKNLGKSEFSDSQIYLNNVGRFDKPQSELDKSELIYKLSDVARFLGSSTSSVSGQRAKRKKDIETLHEHDYSFVNRKNYKEFVDFMEQWRERKIDSIYSSEKVVELYEQSEKKKIDVNDIYNNFEDYLKNLNDIKEIKIPKNTNSSDYIRNKMGF